MIVFVNIFGFQMSNWVKIEVEIEMQKNLKKLLTQGQEDGIILKHSMEDGPVAQVVRAHP